MFAPVAIALLAATGSPPYLRPNVDLEVVTRARSSGSTTEGTRGALELRPTARLLVKTTGWLVTASYQPRMFVGLNTTSLLGVQHLVDGVADWDFARGTRLRLTQRTAYGYEDFGFVQFGTRAW